MLGLLLAGCAAPKVATEEKPKPKPLLTGQITVHSPNGEATVKVEGKLAYHIKWKDGTVAVGQEGPLQGEMDGVSGELYDTDGSPAPFKGDHASAVKEAAKGGAGNKGDATFLTITGQVTIFSKKRQATISCDRLEWRSDDIVIKAKGHVFAAGKFGKLGPGDEMWASKDLSMISTPKMWDPALIPKKPAAQAKKP